MKNYTLEICVDGVESAVNYGGKRGDPTEGMQ